MLFIISPAKALDFSSKMQSQHTSPIFLKKADNLAQKLQKKSPGSLKKLFHVSEELAQLNYERYQNWNTENRNRLGKNALHAFVGHVYQKIDVDSLSEDDLTYANRYLRILSGMYGLLKTTDLILPHRLEMGTKWPVTKRNLYGYWTKHVTKELNKAMDELGTDILINLASAEYFKVIDKKTLRGRIINIDFKEKRETGQYATISIFAKQARGSLCRFAFQNKIQEPEEFQNFVSDGYMFDNRKSTKTNFVFTRG